MKYLLFFFLFVFTFACSKDAVSPKQGELMELINSASVAFSYSSEGMQIFLQNPKQAYVSGYFYFDETLAEDVIFGLDIE